MYSVLPHPTLCSHVLPKPSSSYTGLFSYPTLLYPVCCGKYPTTHPTHPTHPTTHPTHPTSHPTHATDPTSHPTDPTTHPTTHPTHAILLHILPILLPILLHILPILLHSRLFVASPQKPNTSKIILQDTINKSHQFFSKKVVVGWGRILYLYIIKELFIYPTPMYPVLPILLPYHTTLSYILPRPTLDVLYPNPSMCLIWQGPSSDIC